MSVDSFKTVFIISNISNSINFLISRSSFDLIETNTKILLYFR